MISPERNVPAVLDSEIHFERLLVEISTGFINLPVDVIEREIQGVQKLLCKYLDIDRAALYLEIGGRANAAIS
ncbi:MAG: hypothetical protein ACM335_06420 [Deltaproteobacteria bacterium]